MRSFRIASGADPEQSWRFLYKPITLSVLTAGLVVLAYVAMSQDVIEEGREKRTMYVRILISIFTPAQTLSRLVAFTLPLSRFLHFQ